jgi:2-C-methyl-D-erythritol 4-phosphate cytidylyltransferase
MVTAIIVAAGKGARMRDQQRKQYLPLAELPILAHTLRVFHGCERISQIVLVIPQDDFDYCRKNILSHIDPPHNVKLVAGGDRRQISVYQGLQQIDSNCRIVVIHDGVRPFVRPDQLNACIDSAMQFGACILAIPAHETLKRTNSSGRISGTIPRDTIWLAQTPQAFRYEVIQKAHAQAHSDGYEGTDDASLVERLGETVMIIHGSRSNLKITHKEDLMIARALLDARSPTRQSRK